MPEETKEERKARWGSITIGGRSPGLKPTDPNHIRPMQVGQWEKGKVYEQRPGGFRIPMVHNHATEAPVTQKQYADNRAGYDKQRDQLRNDPNGLTKH